MSDFREGVWDVRFGNLRTLTRGRVEATFHCALWFRFATGDLRGSTVQCFRGVIFAVEGRIAMSFLRTSPGL